MADPCNCGGGHAHWGQCQKAKRLRIGYCNSANNLDRTAQNKWDNDLALYREARVDKGPGEEASQGATSHDGDHGFSSSSRTRGSKAKACSGAGKALCLTSRTKLSSPWVRIVPPSA